MHRLRLQRRSVSAMQAGNGCGTNSAAQGLQICHCEAPKGPWQSREGSHDFVGTCLLSTRVLRDFHIASLPGMTNLGVSRHKIHTSNIASLQGGHSPQGHAASVRRQSRQRLRSERRYRRNRCVPLYRYSMRAASVAPGEACLAPTTHDWQPCSTFHSPFSTKKIPDLRPGFLGSTAQFSESIRRKYPAKAKLCGVAK